MAEPPTCVRCGEQRLVEMIGRYYYCTVCSYTWAANPDADD